MRFKGSKQRKSIHQGRPSALKVILITILISIGFWLIIVNQYLNKNNNNNDVPLYKQRIWKDIELPKLPYQQPKSVYQEIKKEFENAQWQPK